MTRVSHFWTVFDRLWRQNLFPFIWSVISVLNTVTTLLVISDLNIVITHQSYIEIENIVLVFPFRRNSSDIGSIEFLMTSLRLVSHYLINIWRFICKHRISELCTSIYV